MPPKVIGRKSAEWIFLAQDRDKELVFVKRVMNLRIPSNVGIS
jgi:hypothetical protein